MKDEHHHYRSFFELSRSGERDAEEWASAVVLISASRPQILRMDSANGFCDWVNRLVTGNEVYRIRKELATSFGALCVQTTVHVCACPRNA